ncbi:BnaC05g32230D [Brassica napus]|uniref:BnaC05g32230D protein n=1 Tax=Brassica napus TaxID=3708 RepID=A0A078GWC6_BRANA|nr:BnaC05g32230D [Brassica napus]
MDSLIFLAPAAAESWTNHRLRSGSTNVCHQTCVITHRLRVELAGEDGEDSDMFVVFYTKMTTIAAVINDVAVKTHSRVKASTSPTSGRPE